MRVREPGYIEVNNDKLETELAFLKSEIYQRGDRSTSLQRLTAYNRFTDRRS